MAAPWAAIFVWGSRFLELVGSEHDDAWTFVAEILDFLLLEFRIERTLGRIVRLLLLQHRPPLAEVGLRHVVGRLLLIRRLLLVVALRLRAVAEQELDEAAAHIGTLGIGRARRGRLRIVGVDHVGLAGRSVECRGGIDTDAEEGRAGEQRKGDVSGHRRTLYWFRL